MSLILTAVEVIGGMAGMAFVCHRIEQVMLARNGYDTRDFFRPIAGPTAATSAPPPIDLKRLLISEEQERLMALSFIDNPTAFWLDPNLWGDDPEWRTRLFPPTPEPLVGSVMRMRGHIDKRKEAENDRLMAAAGIRNPKMTFRAVLSDENFAELPCGCPWETTITRMRAPYTGWHVTRCDRCMAEWEPASNDPSGRRLGQGETVTMADFKHGVCPAEDCRSPCTLDKRGFYYCTNPKCEKHMVGWSPSGQQWVRTKQDGWRHRYTGSEIAAKRKGKKLLAKRNDEDYENDMPPPPRSY